MAFPQDETTNEQPSIDYEALGLEPVSEEELFGLGLQTKATEDSKTKIPEIDYEALGLEPVSEKELFGFEMPKEEPEAPSDWDTLRGAEVSLRQVPQLAYGVAGLVGATSEQITGYGEALRDWGFRGYKEWEESMEPISKETDDITVAWDRAKQGDIGALVDWAQYGVGYALGQLGETAAVSILGGLTGAAVGAPAGGVGAAPAAAGGAIVAAAGKQGFKALAKNLVEKAIASQATKIVTRQAKKEGIELTAEQLAKRASQDAIKRQAGKEIGSNVAVFGNAIGMQLGSIYGEAESKAQAEGRDLTGYDLARVWGMGLATGGIEGVVDKFGLDLLKGKLSGVLPEGRLAGAAVAGGVGTLGEAATEGVQTVGERFGAGKDIFGDEALNEYINAAALGGLGGGVIGGAGGFISGNPKENAAAKAKVAAEAFKNIAPESAKLVGEQADAVINEVAQETPDEKVARLQREAQEAAGIELEEEGAGLPPERIKSARWFESAARNRLKELQDKDDAGVEDFTTQERDEFEFLKTSPTPEQVAERYGYGVAPAVEPTAVTTTTPPTTPAVAEPAPVEPKPTLTPPPTVTEPTAPTTLQPDLLAPEGKTGEERSTIDQENRRKTEEFINGLEDGEYQVFDSSGEKNGIAKVKTNKSGKKVVEYVTDDGKQFIGDAKSLVPELNFARFTDATGKEGFDRGSIQKLAPPPTAAAPVTPTPEAAVAPVEPVVPAEGAVEPTAVAAPTEPVTPTEPTAAEPVPAVAPRPAVDVEALSPNAKRANRILNNTGVDPETAAFVAQQYQDEIADLGGEELRAFVLDKFEENGGMIPAQMRYSEDQEYYELAFGIGPEEAATLVENAKAQNAQMAQAELEQNKQWRRKDGQQITETQQGVAVAQPEAQAVPVTAGEVPPSPAIEGRGIPLAAPETAVTPTPAEPAAEPPTKKQGLPKYERADEKYIQGIRPSISDRLDYDPRYSDIITEAAGRKLSKEQEIEVIVEWMQRGREQGEPALWSDFGGLSMDQAYMVKPSLVSLGLIEPTKAPISPMEAIRRIARGEKAEEGIAGLVDSGFVEVYNGQPVLTQSGINALPKAERPRLTPEARKIQIDTRTSEAAAEAISKNLRIGVDQVPLDVRMPAGWTLEGDIYIPPAVEAAPEVAARPKVTPEERIAKLDRLKKIKAEIDTIQFKPVTGAKVGLSGLTTQEAKKYSALMMEAEGIRFDLRRELDVTKIPTEKERDSAVPAPIVKIASDELVTDRSVFDAIAEAAAGTFFGQDTAVDKVMNGENPNVSPNQFYNTFNKTREALREKFGDTIKLYRAVGKQKEKATQNWHSTKKGASQYGKKVVSRDVPIDDIVALNVGSTGRYEEFIVGKKPAAEVAPTPEVREARREPAITPQQDRDYLDAVERGDLDAASRMVDEAAKKAGYTFGPVWHSGSFDITKTPVFDIEKTAGDGFYFSKRDLKSGPISTRTYLKLSNPLIVDANKSSWTNIKFENQILDTGEIAGRAQTRGFDGVVIRNVIEGGENTPTDVFIAFNPEQIKSADPITRDDQGNIIPLSQRFQPEQADIRYRKRVQMGRAGMETSAVEARLQKLGFPTGGIIRVVNEPDADFEGRTIILDGKVTGIELNAAAMRDNATIDRVLNHEFAESANADGALNRLVERLTPKEKKEINDTITRLRYEERARTAEEAARAIETLAEAWRGRGFFTRAVARVEAWANKLGFKLTRRAAEYIAARNLAEVNENVRKWHIGEAMANIKGARKVSFNGLQAVLIPPSEMRVAYSIAAYHGTPHEIKGKLRISRIGTGEGAAAFGWGLYFAENPEVSEQYRVGRLGTQYAFSYKGVPIYKLEDDGEANAILKIIAGISKEDVVSDLESRLKRIEAENAREEIVSSFRKRVEAAKQIEESEIKQITMGNLYSVQLNVEQDELLDWDKTFNEQSPKVQNAIRKIITEKDFVDKYLANPAKPESKKTGESLYAYVQDALRGNKTERAASLRLLREGVKGIQYLDQQSRAEAEGTRNYVIFDENVIEITGRNGEPVSIRESRREPEAIPTFTEGTPEAATLKEMAASMAKVDAASEAKGGKPETYKISEIASVWMDSGLGERELQDAIVEYTNLTPANAKRVARAIAKQYDTQQQLAEAVLETEAGVTVEGLPEGMEIPKDVDPKNKRTVLQRVIDATTGVRVKPVILQVPEKSALKEQIRMKARETREAKKAQQETADAVVEAIKALELRGPMRPKQAQALAKRAAKVIWTSEKSMENFIAYAERVMANTNYDADLREAKAAQKRAKELSKRDSIAAPQRETLEAIGNIGINLLNDPREFADVVNHYLRSFKPVVSEAYVVVPDAEMKSYLSAAEDVVNDAKAEFEAEDNERLADKYGITIDELKKYMDAEEIMDALTRYAKREVIEGILNEKSANVKEALNGVDTTTLRADQRKLIDAMKVIDVKSLDVAEKQAYVRIGNNIIFNNNQTNGAEFFVATAKGQQAARDLAKNTEAMTKNKAWANVLPSLGSRKAKKLLKSWASELQSIADTFRNAFGKEAMTVFYEAMGMVDLDLGFTQAARTLEEIQEKMAKFYDKLDKKYKGAARTQDGILSEGIVGYLIQNVPSKGEADSLAQRRNLMQQNVANLRKSGDEDKIQMADRVQQLMQRLDGDTVDQILANLKREYPANHESLMWLKDDLFPQYKDFLKFSDENFNDQANNYNTPNYLPIIYSNASPALDLLQGKKKYYDNLSSSPKQSSYTIKRSDYTQLPMGSDGRTPKEIGLNLRKNAYNSLSDQITRAYTNPARQRIYSFLKTPEAEEALGGKANLDFFADRIERLMGSRERRGSLNEGFFGKAVDVIANLVRDIGTRIALAGSYQLIRQPADQVTVAVGATGRADLMAEHLAPRSIKNARPVLDLFSIGRRGDASSGYKYINQMEGAQSRLERYYTEGNWVKAKEAAKNFADKFMAPLKVSDFTVAAATWMTFYRAYLAKNGIKFTTWEDAANLIKSDDAGHKRAAAYAENMTDIYQGSSDPTKMAVFAQKGKTGTENLLKSILVPFNSFGIQFRARISSDITEIFTRSGDWKGKAIAVKDLSATIGGTVMFGLAKRFVLPAITYGGIKILYAIFGVDVEEPDEEKKKEEFDQKWRQLQGDIISTMVAGGFGQMIEGHTIDGMNYIKYMIDTANESESVLDDDGEIMSFNKYSKERAPFYRYRSFDNAPSLGMLDIGMDQAGKAVLNTKMVLTPEEMERFTPEEQRFLYVALVSDWLYLAGFNDADFARMWDKGRRDMINARKEEEKELNRIRSGR